MAWILTYIIPFLLASDAFFLGISGGVTLRPFKWITGLKIAIVFALVLGIAALLAFFLGQAIRPLIADFANLTGHIFILFTGIRLINDAKKIKNEERTYLLEDNRILFTGALAASFIIFLAFFGLGLVKSDFEESVISLGTSVFILSFLGVFTGSHYKPLRLGRSSKFASGLLISVLIIIHYINQL